MAKTKEKPIQQKDKSHILIGNFDQLVKDWKIVYAQIELIDENIDKGVCMESLCVGWCLAKGLTIKSALHFYKEMIPLELF